MSQHTPGPWVIASYGGEHEEAGARITGGPEGRVIAGTSSIWAKAPPEAWATYYADAHLIAAAPELAKALRLTLKALRQCRAYYETEEGDTWDFGEADDAEELADAALAQAASS